MFTVEKGQIFDDQYNLVARIGKTTADPKRYYLAINIGNIHDDIFIEIQKIDNDIIKLQILCEGLHGDAPNLPLSCFLITNFSQTKEQYIFNKSVIHFSSNEIEPQIIKKF